LHLTKPFHQLTKKGDAWKLAKEEQVVFEELKFLIMSIPILVQPNQNAQFRLETNALGYTTRAVLSQICNNGQCHPVDLTSKGLDAAKRNYKIHDKELLSVIHGLEEWRHILEGTKYKIEILKDHQKLTHFWTSQNSNHRQAHWSLWLSHFDFSLVHT